MFTLTTSKTTNPDFSGLKFFVESGGEFDVRDFAEHNGLRMDAIDEQSWKGVQDEASHLNPGEWLEVGYEGEPD